jgi:hypothetical protein
MMVSAGPTGMGRWPLRRPTPTLPPRLRSAVCGVAAPARRLARPWGPRRTIAPPPPRAGGENESGGGGGEEKKKEQQQTPEQQQQQPSKPSLDPRPDKKRPAPETQLRDAARALRQLRALRTLSLCLEYGAIPGTIAALAAWALHIDALGGWTWDANDALVGLLCFSPVAALDAFLMLPDWPGVEDELDTPLGKGGGVGRVAAYDLGQALKARARVRETRAAAAAARKRALAGGVVASAAVAARPAEASQQQQQQVDVEQPDKRPLSPVSSTAALLERLVPSTAAAAAPPPPPSPKPSAPAAEAAAAPAAASAATKPPQQEEGESSSSSSSTPEQQQEQTQQGVSLAAAYERNTQIFAREQREQLERQQEASNSSTTNSIDADQAALLRQRAAANAARDAAQAEAAAKEAAAAPPPKPLSDRLAPGVRLASALASQQLYHARNNPGANLTPLEEGAVVFSSVLGEEMLQRAVGLGLLAGWLRDRGYEAGLDDELAAPSWLLKPLESLVAASSSGGAGGAGAGLDGVATLAGGLISLPDAAKLAAVLLTGAGVMALALLRLARGVGFPTRATVLIGGDEEAELGGRGGAAGADNSNNSAKPQPQKDEAAAARDAAVRRALSSLVSPQAAALLGSEALRSAGGSVGAGLAFCRR